MSSIFVVVVGEDGRSSALSVVFGSSVVDSTFSGDEAVEDEGSVPADVDGVAVESVVGVWLLVLMVEACSANGKSKSHNYSHSSQNLLSVGHTHRVMYIARGHTRLAITTPIYRHKLMYS